MVKFLEWLSLVLCVSIGYLLFNWPDSLIGIILWTIIRSLFKDEDINAHYE